MAAVTPVNLEPQRLKAQALIPVTATSWYTATDSGLSCGLIYLCNLFSQTGYVSVQLLESGGSLDDDNYLYHKIAVHGHRTRILEVPILNSGDVLYIWADGMGQQQINNGGGYNNSATSIAWDTAVGAALPAAGRAVFQQDTTPNPREEFDYTALGTPMTGVVRGVGGTAAAAHADNALILNYYITAGLFGVVEGT